MPKNRLKSVNRLGTTMTTRRMSGRGKRLMRRTQPGPWRRRARGRPRRPAPRAAPRSRGTRPLASRTGSSPCGRPRPAVGHDAPCDETRDLPHEERPGGRAEAYGSLLVVEARLVGRRVQECSLVVADQLDRADRWIAVDVY